MKISMLLTCQIFSKESGTPKMLTKEETHGLSIGGFFFIIDGKEIPFDWEDFNGVENEGIFRFETGYGWFKNFELDDCYAEDYKALGIAKNDINAQYLASAERISEVHMNFIDSDGDECDFGTNDENELFYVHLIDITLCDIKTGKQYALDKNVIEEFNNRIQASTN